MILRVYVEKRPEFDSAAKNLASDLRNFLGIKGLSSLRKILFYDVEGIDEQLFEHCIPIVFSEPQTDVVYRDFPLSEEEINAPDIYVLAVEYLPGQFDQCAHSASECIQLVSQKERPVVHSAQVYIFRGNLDDKDYAAIKSYLINPVEARQASLQLPNVLINEIPEPERVERLDDFCELPAQRRAEFIEHWGLAMDEADLAFCQHYFSCEERRAPSITEIKVIDTYWSDHCRHTTFGTELSHVAIQDPLAQQSFDTYQKIRAQLGRNEKPICMMDLATIAARYLKSQGKLKCLDESEEINACTVKCKVDVDGKEQDWLFLFKNETHNHPTEIEPFGGAATCIGGCIRDPLSGRSYVYQAMRLTGAADPRARIEDTLAGKLPQRKICIDAAQGYSSYGNQIGLATGQVSEIYHPSYLAKRLEIGAVVGAAPACNVRRETPEPGDVVVLVGGDTGRDGIGGATGSSKAHTSTSVKNLGAEVQKGNAPTERKIQRLFRRKQASALIKRCNDFGAGGVSVAVGELARGLSINLDAVPRKYAGLDGTELAISESQERMAVVLAARDVDTFLELAHEENLQAVPIAEVTADERLVMKWQEDTIVNISRSFLDLNGAPRKQSVVIEPAFECVSAFGVGMPFKERMKTLVGSLNVCSQIGLAERFDSTIGAASVLLPFGGTRQLTPAQAMVAKFPTFGETNTCSGMAWGFNPAISEKDAYAAAYLAVVESVSKLIATGFTREQMYLSFQEYFPKLRDVSNRWGKPLSALLGALQAQLDLEIAAIGGKDSMSGSFEDIDVVSTLVSFAAAVGNAEYVVSGELKGADHRLICIDPAQYDERYLPQAQGLNEVFSLVEELVREKSALAIYACDGGYCASAMFKMCLGNKLGIALDEHVPEEAQFVPAYGSFIIELTEGAELPAHSDAIHIHEIGQTIEAYELHKGDEVIKLDELEKVWESTLEDIYPYKKVPSENESEELAQQDGEQQDGEGEQQSGAQRGNGAQRNDAQKCLQQNVPQQSVFQEEKAADSTPLISYTDALPLTLNGSPACPRVLIPVFPGTNCEYDMARAFECAGGIPQIFVINNLSAHDVSQSVHAFARAIDNAQIIALPGGFSGGDEPDGAAKLITAFFRSPEIKEALQNFLENKDGLMLGICNGFQALVKLGLVPFGEVKDMDDMCPTLTFNTIGRHVSKMVNTRIASNLSPWFSRVNVGDVYQVPISHGEGRFVAPEALLLDMQAKGQIATQYVDAQGVPASDISVNPNGSIWAIEGITSPDGRILGKMGHSERTGAQLYKNMGKCVPEPIFESGVGYFMD